MADQVQKLLLEVALKNTGIQYDPDNPPAEIWLSTEPTDPTKRQLHVLSGDYWVPTSFWRYL